MKMTEDEIFTILKKVLFLPKETLLEKVGKRFFSTLPFSNHVWRNEHVIRMTIKQVKYIMKITDSYDKNVIELGCGLGFHAIITALSGVHEITALDFSEETIKMIENMVSIVNEPELYEKLHLVAGDACDTKLPSGSYDVISMFSMISHCQNLDILISEISRLAKPDALVYIYDDNNGLKFGEKKEIIQIQQIVENGPLEEAHKQGKCRGIKSTYLDVRKEIIRKHFSSLDESTIDELAGKTSGMYGEQIITTVENYLAGEMKDKLKKYEPSYPDVCVVKPLYKNPVNGMWPEIAFSPYKLRDYFNSKGMDVSIIPYMHHVISGGIKGFIKRQLAIIIKILYPASIFIAPGFELLGKVKGTVKN